MSKDIRAAKVTKRIVHISGRELTESEKNSTDVEYRPGIMGGQVVHDHRMESHEARRFLRDGEGKICISVQPGDELGELIISIQFEGPIDTGRGEPDQCMKGQNALLTQASAWIAEILAAYDAEYEVEIESQPCPKSSIPVAIAEAAQAIETGVVQVRVRRAHTSGDAQRQVE